MISIIICSRESDISTSLKENISRTIGIEYELIVIDNSKNRYSIFSAYNTGYKKSKFPFLCFIHEDILFQTDNWGTKIIDHLDNPETGIIGVAGGKIATQVPSQWSAGGRSINIIQHQSKKEKIRIKDPQDFTGTSQAAILIDGLFLCMRHKIFKKIKFDEKIKGFHGYDYDISIQSIVAGYKNYVIYDVLIEHFSEGKKDIGYYETLINIYKKWEKHLPLFSSDTTKATRENIIQIEVKSLARLIRRMARAGVSTKKIVDAAVYFAEHSKAKEIKKLLKFIHFKIFFQRLVKSPKFLFR